LWSPAFLLECHREEGVLKQKHHPLQSNDKFLEKKYNSNSEETCHIILNIIWAFTPCSTTSHSKFLILKTENPKI
jgi:hypothetical protein